MVKIYCIILVYYTVRAHKYILKMHWANSKQHQDRQAVIWSVSVVLFFFSFLKWGGRRISIVRKERKRE